MIASSDGKKITFVMGATATGKSDWALELAEKTGAVIVNCDSVQVYEGPRIGSNVPSEEDFARVPHHLYSYVKAPDEMSAGRFRADFFALVERLPAKARVIAVGGTGFYFRAIEKGMFEAPPVDPEVAAQVRAEGATPEGVQALWRELERGDAETAAKLPVQDSYRIMRAVELLRSGAVPSEIQKNFTPKPFPWPLHKTALFMDRPELHRRIEVRTELMLKAGLIAETAALLKKAAPEWAPLQSVGYKEVQTFLNEQKSETWLRDEIVLRTFQLTKRQNTWFKKEAQTSKYDVGSDRARFIQEAQIFFDADFPS